MENDCVQYIIVRKDLVEQMGYGKLAAQACHASLGAVVEKVNGETKLRESDAIKKWFSGKFTKLVTYVKSKEALLNLAGKLDNDGLMYRLIYDACLTKLEPEENGKTLTCIGIVPMERNSVPKYLKKLQLLD